MKVTVAPRKKRKMSSSTPDVMTAAVLTVSDSSSRGERADLSGPAVVEILRRKHFVIVATEVVADEQPAIEEAIIRLAGNAHLVATTGGTGIAERDVTPEATRAVCTRLLEGEIPGAESARKSSRGGRVTGSGGRSAAACIGVAGRKHNTHMT